MKAEEFRKLTVDELSAKEFDLKDEFNRLKFQHSIRPLENTARLKEMKRDIARLMTVVNEKQQS
jgi:large subunit ribosomal protein L29